MIINPKVVKKGISEEQLEAWAEVNTALEEAVGYYTIEINTANYFTFDRNACTGYIGDPDAIVVVPKSYSTVTSTETVVGAKVLDKREISRIIRDFQSITFSDGEDNSHTYRDLMELDMLADDFPNDCYLISMRVRDSFNFNFLREAYDMQILQFPIAINGQSFSDGMAAFEYILSNDITNVNFDGDVEVIKFVDGDDYTVTSIVETSGFSNCTKEIVLLENITTIDYYAFYNCSELNSIDLTHCINLTKIGNFAFGNCLNLKNIYIPKNVSEIIDTAFHNCNNLKTITVNESNINFSSENGVLYNKNKSSLLKYPVAKKETFFSIPNSVTAINDNAFSYCENLENIVMPEFVTNIGMTAFYGCINLKSITIPSNVNVIETSVFTKCTSLTSIEIPSKVTSIKSYAFYDCTSLAEIIVLAETPPTIQSSTFSNGTDNRVFYVPDASVDVYKQATNWTRYADQIQPLSAKGGVN